MDSEDSTSLGALEKEKEAFRARMRELRARIPSPERRQMATAVERRILALEALRAPATVMMFHSFGSEIPTAEMAKALAGAGHSVLLPFLEEGEIHAAQVRHGEELLPTAYGPKEPAARPPVELEEIDVVVLPGLAFDREGYRIGYGGGHYDRFLDRPRLSALRVGIGFHFQVVPRVPRGPNDRHVDLVVTDEETIVCRTGD